jgi:hypothetical protein
MTPEEKNKYERQAYSYKIGYKYEMPKEKAVKINVKKKINEVEDNPDKIENLKIH